MILASDIRWKIFAYGFSLWENRCCLSVCDIRKNLPKGLRLAEKSFETIPLSCLWYDFTMICFFEFYFSLSVRFCFGVFFAKSRKWRLGEVTASFTLVTFNPAAIDHICCSLSPSSFAQSNVSTDVFFIPEWDFRATFPAFNTWWSTHHNPNKQLTF